MQKKIIIGIAGNIGAGKGTITEYLVEKYNAKKMRYSKILADILERLYLDYDRNNLNIIAEGLRNMFGKDILSKVLEKDIKEIEAEIVVFDGIRKKKELDYFKNKINNFFFIFVDAPFEVVAKRIISRQEKIDDQEQTAEKLRASQQQDSDKDVPNLKQYANFVIDNSGELKAAYEQVDKMMKEIL
jgi:dephospho-CoA kinase